MIGKQGNRRISWAWLLAAAAVMIGAVAWPNEAAYASTSKAPVEKQGTVYLTFDDGPSKWTPQVLDILARHNVLATFFVLGESAERYEDTVRRIVNEGHALGNHTYNHVYKELYQDFMGFWKQVKRTDEALTRITGKHTALLRAPGGTYTNFDASYFDYMHQAGYTIFDWNMDSGDSKRQNVPAAEIVKTVKQSQLKEEVVLLMHDGSGHGESVKALPAIIRYFKDKGYRFAALNEGVKPVTFPLGPLKWKRSWTEEQHVQAKAAIQDMASADEWIPLREWAAGKGTVDWDSKAREALLQLGDLTMRLVPTDGQSVRIIDGGSIGEREGIFRIMDNRIYILKSAASELFP
ncbi:polysaccharide deacetylase family protein [Paenibacillus mendelii]|uniref:Polysaccharide deacetylase family protein n=1 Tax=Paenibacillus mendelii TaxID=206163 RepID=A0ABV6J1N5_9BACL|nr:polysaccharide deacetylase family protein [Paenibacillus mendelii]MCQ6563200.1 polysaccharide deacetylase [Paenibacillus mendelii]